MPRFTALLFSLTAFLSAAAAELSPECVQETEALQKDGFLDMVQNDLYTTYQDDFNSLCDFSSVTNPDCGLEFDGNNKTYVAACEDKGGQVLTRPVTLKCGYSVATVDLGLGSVPTCIGISCNASAVGTEQLVDTRVEQFFKNLSFTGCSADYSAGISTSLFGVSASLSVIILALF